MSRYGAATSGIRWRKSSSAIRCNARFPTPDRSTQLAEFSDRSLAEIPRGPFPQRIIEETEEDLNEFVANPGEAGRHRQAPGDLAARGEVLHDPLGVPGLLQLLSPRHLAGHRRPDHRNAQCHPQPLAGDIQLSQVADGLSEVRRKVVQRPQTHAAGLALRGVDLEKPTPRNDEPAFDAANVLRFGQDLIYLVSATGNEMGGNGCRSILGDKFRVHFLKDVYYGSHIDSTLVALRPGLVLCNPARVNDDTLPEILKQWKVIYSPPMENTDRYDADYLSKCIGSDWIDMNAFSINPNLVVVDRDQPALIKTSGEARGSMSSRSNCGTPRCWAAGPHCVTLDIRRKGTLATILRLKPRFSHVMRLGVCDKRHRGFPCADLCGVEAVPLGGEKRAAQADTCPYSLTDVFDDRHLVNVPHQKGVRWLTEVFSRSAERFPESHGLADSAHRRVPDLR